MILMCVLGEPFAGCHLVLSWDDPLETRGILIWQGWWSTPTLWAFVVADDWTCLKSDMVRGSDPSPWLEGVGQGT